MHLISHCFHFSIKFPEAINPYKSCSMYSKISQTLSDLAGSLLFVTRTSKSLIIFLLLSDCNNFISRMLVRENPELIAVGVEES